MVKARQNDPLSTILQESTDLVGTTLEQIEWAESEIDAAIARHPTQGDLLYHGFGLLRPTHRLMATEFVSRSHYRELLDRLATGKDTRPGTAAEVCCACCEASLVAPLSSTAAGLYFRMWESAFPDMPPVTDRTQHYEALDSSSIDAVEAASRRTLARENRIVGDVSCTGMHHGAVVPCTYAAAGAKATAPTSPTHRHLSARQPAATPGSKAEPAFEFEPPGAPSVGGPNL
ncbi:hypothetical protein C8K30_1177 [Promicromonospora sp. AC04]|uniref:hypothetical protein n=1 Tax=Promicromonospora sp. AC04 TaxID=2135723 RepID=UPI000D335518|nr:hypothetical protein [Promicromonospora sp. AC04]PUB20182.1 hypothetical protein C8K30_1177 [Promicromonospora sp. AC04]